MVEKEWLNFLMDFYGMRYKGGYDEQYADEILKILSERSDFEG